MAGRLSSIEDEDFEDSRKSRKNIFDDDVSFADAKRHIMTAGMGYDDDGGDDDDTINWDGTPAVKYNKPTTEAGSGGKSGCPGIPGSSPDLSNLATPVVASGTSPSPFTSSTTSAPGSYGGYGRAAGLTHNRSQSLTYGSKSKTEEAGRRPMQGGSMQPSISDPRIDEIVSSNAPERQLTPEDYTLMQKEIVKLKHALRTSKHDRWHKIPVDETIRRMIRGESCSLQMYRSKGDKLALLDQAIQVHDGNAITAAVLHLKETIKPSIFNLELTKRPVAVSHYLAYLKAHYDFAELFDMLSMLGRVEEAAMLKYKMAISSRDTSHRVRSLETCYKAHFASDPGLQAEASLVKEQIDLLQRQLPIEEADSKEEASGRSQVFQQVPRKMSLVGMSVITTLYYCCLYHYHLDESNQASPAALRKRHQLTEKQFQWTAVAARGRVRYWKDIESMMVTKGFLGSTRMRAAIGFDKVVEVLHKAGAPPDILVKYLGFVDDSMKRLVLAKKVNCPKGIVDALVAVKDRAQLEAYAAKLSVKSPEGLYAFDALNSSSTKWK